MKHRMSRNNKARSGFKIDSLLQGISEKKDNIIQPGYINITFLGT